MTALEKRFKELVEAQGRRASVLESALKDFERRTPSLRIKTPQDYVAISKHQRLLVGLDTEKSKVELSGGLNINIVDFSKTVKPKKGVE